MYKFNRTKFYKGIFMFLNETVDIKNASIQANEMVDNIGKILQEIDVSINKKNHDISTLIKKFHILKNMLLYGDFHYECDICEDIEIKLCKEKDVSKILSMYENLVDVLSS